MSRYIWGVYRAAPGYKILGICPQFGDLEHAQGTYPSPKGDVHLSLTCNANGFAAAITSKICIWLKIITQSGHAQVLGATHYGFGGALKLVLNALAVK